MLREPQFPEQGPEKPKTPAEIYAEEMAEKAARPILEEEKDKTGNYFKIYWEAYREAYWDYIDHKKQ
ncbi:MAG: hypothetical protein V1667_00625 [bacterium]